MPAVLRFFLELHAKVNASRPGSRAPLGLLLANERPFRLYNAGTAETVSAPACQKSPRATKVRRFSHRIWRKKRTKALPKSELFQIHGCEFELDPVRNCFKPAVWRITHPRTAGAPRQAAAAARSIVSRMPYTFSHHFSGNRACRLLLPRVRIQHMGRACLPTVFRSYIYRTNEVVQMRMNFARDATAKIEDLLAVNRDSCRQQIARNSPLMPPPNCAGLPKISA